MDRSNVSSSSNVPSNLARSGSSSSGTFAYQARLLESTSSRGSASGGVLNRTSSLSRTNSIGNRGALPTATSPALDATRRWTPTHRSNSSLDAVRGKWEERARAEAVLEGSSRDGGSKDNLPPTPTLSRSSDATSSSSLSSERSRYTTPVKASHTSENGRTPTYLKRHTMPAPIIASPLSPNNTGVTLETSELSSSLTGITPGRIHVPSASSFYSASSQSDSSASTSRFAERSYPGSPSRSRRSSAVDSLVSQWTGSHAAVQASSPILPSTSSPTRAPLNTNMPPPPVPSGLKRNPSVSERRQMFAGSPEKPLPLLTRSASQSPERPSPAFSPTSTFSPTTPKTPPNSVMTPAPYRSSYMANKKASTYGDNMIVGRRLGRHLPRIASGDQEDEAVTTPPKPPPKDDGSPVSRRERVERRRRNFGAHADISVPMDPIVRGVGEGDGVIGIPGRVRLARDRKPATLTTPLPSAKLARGTGYGLWADTQRHLIQAYEYLCHVGEAQQWIEGCLGQELEFGVVEMEEGLRNGVVLAKLSRVFQGEAAVKRIYDVCPSYLKHRAIRGLIGFLGSETRLQAF